MVRKNKDNSINREKSIYYDLKKFYDQNLGVLYSYQDFETAGIKEFNCITNRTPSLKEHEKNRLANGLVKILFKDESIDETLLNINEYVKSYPIINYYKNFIKSFTDSLEFNRNSLKINNLMKKMIVESNSSEEIKLGLILAPVCELENIKEILSVFSIHNDYIFYVVKAYEYIGKCNDIIFELAKKSNGYGKVFCVMNLSPTNHEIKKWMIEEGAINKVGVPELLSSSMLSLDILEYLESKTFNGEEIEVFAKSFSMMLSDYELDEVKDGIKICDKLVEIIDKVDGEIYSLYSVISIIYSIEATLIDDFKTKRSHSFFKFSNQVKEIIETCKKICKKERWHKIIADEISNENIESSVLISCSEKTNYQLKKKEFEIILKRDNANPLLYKYAFSIGNKSLKKYAFTLGLKKLPMDKLLSGQDEIRIDNLAYEDIAQICFFIIIKYSKYDDFIGEYKELNLKALKSPLVETRIQAVTNLQRFREEFDSADNELIHDAIDGELVGDIRKILNSLLIKTNNKEKKYIEIKENMHIDEHTKDVYLNNIYVASINYVDISEVYNKLLEENLLYLQREPNNEYDSNAILISTVEGYVIGYVPKESNLILKNLMDKGKYIYGKIKEISDDYQSINIDIYLSYKDVIEEITGTLSLLSGERKFYLQ
jgi:hypothetical protein